LDIHGQYKSKIKLKRNAWNEQITIEYLKYMITSAAPGYPDWGVRDI